ncbi:MAG: G-D-S-L family lipolytic protein [Rhodococcus sp.]|uniref:GDSL-type esterase/lipase family protein n=1 Tax=Rhodococcus yananensis TaxID=2879464 RepID=UPI00169EA4EC|nr:GDSL-type esterase/lipase family protein [Rhodococcus yananensis]NLV80022.1 G-D-S-L family lipolytic protein [Rhodococcus sp. (in: high G+C Gram-positive bacteria)]
MNPLPVRLCVFGDSFVAGVGDPQCRGWVGRVGERALGSGVDLTVYNLGVRRDTSADVRNRWLDEAVVRLPAGFDNRVIVSFGVNDTTAQDDSTRVPTDDAVAHLTHVLGEAATRGWRMLVVGPPPIADGDQNVRTATLDERFALVCAARNVPYVPVFSHLVTDPVWLGEVRSGDGAHPGSAGYDRLAELVYGVVVTWLGGDPRSSGADRNSVGGVV